MVNLAARLCDHAENGQVLLSRRALVDVESHVETTPVPDLQLKGVKDPVVAYNVVDLHQNM